MNFEDLVAALQNWGRWSRDDPDSLGFALSSINRLAGRTRDRDSYEVPPGEVEVACRPDERSALELNRFMGQLERRAFVTLRRRYYHREWVACDEHDAAVRSLADLMGRAVRNTACIPR